MACAPWHYHPLTAAWNLMRWAMLIALLLFASAPVQAQPEAPSPPAASPETAGAAPEFPGTTSPIITDSALAQAYQSCTVQITPAMTCIGGAFNRGWQRQGVAANLPVGHHTQQQRAAEGNYRYLQVQVEVYYGLTPRCTASVVAPFRQNWAGQVGPTGQADSAGGFANPMLRLRYVLVDGGAAAATLTGYFAVTFPLGASLHPPPPLLSVDQTGQGAFGFTWGLNIFRYVPQVPVLLYANLWYTNYTNSTFHGPRTYYEDQLTVNFALEFPLTKSPENRWAFLLEVLSTSDIGRVFGPPANQGTSLMINALPALEFLPSSWFRLAAGVPVSVLGKNAFFNYTPTLACFISF